MTDILNLSTCPLLLGLYGRLVICLIWRSSSSSFIWALVNLPPLSLWSTLGVFSLRNGPSTSTLTDPPNVTWTVPASVNSITIEASSSGALGTPAIATRWRLWWISNRHHYCSSWQWQRWLCQVVALLRGSHHINIAVARS